MQQTNRYRRTRDICQLKTGSDVIADHSVLHHMIFYVDCLGANKKVELLGP